MDSGLIGSIVTIVVIILFAIVKFACFPKQSPLRRSLTYDDKVKNAMQYYGVNFGEAMPLFEELIEDPEFSDPRQSPKLRARLYFYLGTCYARLGFFAEAEKMLNKGNAVTYAYKFIKGEENLAWARYYAELCFRGDNCQDKAEEHYKIAAESEYHFDAMSELTGMHLFLFNFERALEIAEEYVIECEKDYVPKKGVKKQKLLGAYACLLNIYRLTGNIEKFREVVEKAQVRRIEEADWWAGELIAIEKDDLIHRINHSKPLSEVLLNLRELYRAERKRTFKLALYAQRSRHAKLPLSNKMFSLDLSGLPAEFKKSNALPEQGQSLSVAFDEKGNPFVEVGEEKAENFLCDHRFHLKELMVSRVNAELFEKCCGMSIEEAMKISLINAFAFFYRVGYDFIGLENFKDKDGKEGQRVLRFYVIEARGIIYFVQHNEGKYEVERENFGEYEDFKTVEGKFAE